MSETKSLTIPASGHSARALTTLVSVFFFWGFVAASNDILIPVFKDQLKLEQWQSQLISVSFYVAYTVGAIIYFLISRLRKKDILHSMGYKNGVALGLVISALGTLLFYPAAQTSSFGLMISGLFIVGLGFSLQQITANPLAVNIGDPRKGSQRLSLAGGINNIGTTIGPIIVSFAIFGSLKLGAKLENLESVKTPYLFLGAAFLIVAVIFKYSSLPNHIEHVEKDEPAEATEVDFYVVPDSDFKHSSRPQLINHEKQIEPVETEFSILPVSAEPVETNLSVISAVDYKHAPERSALSYPQLWLGMIGIFLYVGVEVSTASNLPEFMRQHLHIATDQVAPYVSLFWASLMIGRWTGAIGAFGVKKSAQQVLNFVLPYIAFGVFLLANYIASHDLKPFYMYSFVIIAIIIADMASKGNPARQLMIFSVMGIIALLIGILADGMVSVYAFISVGLFCSTLWPCIFTLAIAGLGKRTNDGSSFLIMMIMGGGLISWLQGYLAKDNLLGIQFSYVVGIACFAYLVFYGWRAKHLLIKRGIDYDAVSGGH